MTEHHTPKAYKSRMQNTTHFRTWNLMNANDQLHTPANLTSINSLYNTTGQVHSTTGHGVQTKSYILAFSRNWNLVVHQVMYDWTIPDTHKGRKEVLYSCLILNTGWITANTGLGFWESSIVNSNFPTHISSLFHMIKNIPLETWCSRQQPFSRHQCGITDVNAVFKQCSMPRPVSIRSYFT
jgi:hypothetical protein